VSGEQQTATLSVLEGGAGVARIPIVTPDTAEGRGREILSQVQAQYGYIPGIVKVLLPDLEMAGHAKAIYAHLNFRPGSPFTRVQREMVATVVNGLVGGAP
jgi:hypothetical protein